VAAGGTGALGQFGLCCVVGVQMRFDRATPYNSLFLLFERILRLPGAARHYLSEQLYLASAECANVFPKIFDISCYLIRYQSKKLPDRRI
jgi:hypothetical protein